MAGRTFRSGDPKNRPYKQLDADFKRAVHNTDILSNVIGELVSELNGMDIEHIKRCISPDNLTRVPGLETEMHNDSDEYVIMDNLFSVTIPGEKRIDIIINIEAQGDSEPGYPLINRALYYASGIIFNQKGPVFSGSHYEDLRKTYSIWFILQPRKGEGNSIVRYPLVRTSGLKKDYGRSEDCNLLEIIIVNLGGSQDAPNRAFRMFNDIFLSKSRGEEYRNRLRDSYNIEVDDTTLQSLERIGMSLGEEIVNFQRREGYRSGFEEGREEGYEQGYEEASRSVTSQKEAAVIINLMAELGLSREKAMEIAEVSDENREEVNRIVDERLSSN